MKRCFIGGLVLGALLASGGFIAYRHFTCPARSVRTKGTQAEPHWWLLPADFSISSIYTEADARSVLEAPGSIRIHRSGPGGGISLLGHHFASDGIAPSTEDAQLLLKAFHAPNAYSGLSECAFDPGVLVRMKRDEHQLDLLICFSCEDMAWVLDGDETGSSMAGLSDIGIGTLRSIFHRAFPAEEAFKVP
jgi:hypothetical protein